MKLTAAIIGCGRVVREGHLLGFKEASDRIAVVAVADPVRGNREYVGEHLGVPKEARFADFRELLDTVECDFVDVALPHFLHEEAIVASAHTGRNILTEKPLTTSTESAARIVEAVRHSGVVFGIQHNYVHFPHFAALQRAVCEGLIGEPFLVRFESIGGGGHWPGAAGYDPDWRIRAARGGGGTLIDNGYHSLYLCEYWMGRPVAHVTARTQAVRGGEVEDLAFVLLDHADGGLSSAQVSWAVTAPGRRVVEVHGESGSLSISEENEVQVFADESGKWIPYFTPEHTLSFRFTYTDSFLDFADAVDESRDPSYSLRAAVHNLAIIMAGYESAEREKTVSVESVERKIMCSEGKVDTT